MKYNLLVIDDEIEIRKEVYEKILLPEYFELKFIERFDIATIENLIDGSNIHGIIIDLYLENWQKGNEKELFLQFLDYIGHKKPIILVSRLFQKIASWVQGSSPESNDVILMFGWEEICDEKGDVKSEAIPQLISSKIIHSLKGYYQRTNSLKGPDEKLTALIISDLQFGDPKFSAEISIAAPQLGSELTGKFSIKPDFLILAGDIGQTGLPSQFAQASNWIRTLCKYIFPESFTNYYERILIVAGNHDINLTLSASDYYEYDFEHLPDKNTPEKFTYLKYRDKPINEHYNYGLIPFCEFAYNLTKNSDWIHQRNNLCWKNDKFLDWGIRFIHLNSVSELNYKTPKKVSLKQENIGELIESIKLPDNSNLMTVVLSHNGPEDFGYVRGEENTPQCVDLFTLINTIKAKLLISGHRHKPSLGYGADYEGDYTSDMKYIMCGTLSLKDLAPDTLRSFSVVEFDRSNGNVVGAKHKIFELREGSIRLEKTKTLF